MGKTEYADLGKVNVERISDSGKAVLIKRDKKTHWVPISVLQEDTASRVSPDAGALDSFEVAEWFLEKEEIEV